MEARYMQTIINLLINAIAVFTAAYLLPGITVDSFLSAIVVAIVLAGLNYLVKPVLILLTLPVTLITFGLFIFVINALIVALAGYFVPGFIVGGFVWALLFSLLMSVINAILLKLFK